MDPGLVFHGGGRFEPIAWIRLVCCLNEQISRQVRGTGIYRREYGNLWRMDQQVRDEALEGLDLG